MSSGYEDIEYRDYEHNLRLSEEEYLQLREYWEAQELEYYSNIDNVKNKNRSIENAYRKYFER